VIWAGRTAAENRTDLSVMACRDLKAAACPQGRQGVSATVGVGVGVGDGHVEFDVGHGGAAPVGSRAVG
jgi:hypothetical protein